MAESPRSTPMSTSAPPSDLPTVGDLNAALSINPAWTCAVEDVALLKHGDVAGAVARFDAGLALAGGLVGLAEVDRVDVADRHFAALPSQLPRRGRADAGGRPRHQSHCRHTHLP